MIQKENHLQYFFYRHKRIFEHFFVSSFLFNWLFKKIFGIFHIIKCIFSLQFVRKVPASTLFLANKLSINMRHLRSPRVSLLEENVKEKCDYIFLHKRIEKFFYWGWSFLLNENWTHILTMGVQCMKKENCMKYMYWDI